MALQEARERRQMHWEDPVGQNFEAIIKSEIAEAQRVKGAEAEFRRIQILEIEAADEARRVRREATRARQLAEYAEDWLVLMCE